MSYVLIVIVVLSIPALVIFGIMAESRRRRRREALIGNDRSAAEASTKPVPSSDR